MNDELEPTSSSSSGSLAPRAGDDVRYGDDRHLLEADLRSLDAELGSLFRAAAADAAPADLVDRVMASSRWRLPAPRDLATPDADRVLATAISRSAATAHETARALPMSRALPRWLIAGSALAACLTIGVGAVMLVVLAREAAEPGGPLAVDDTATQPTELVSPTDSGGAAEEDSAADRVGSEDMRLADADRVDPSEAAPVGDGGAAAGDERLAAADGGDGWGSDAFDATFELAALTLSQRIENIDRDLQNPMWARSHWDDRAASGGSGSLTAVASAITGSSDSGIRAASGSFEAESATVTGSVVNDANFRRRVERMNDELLAF